MPPKRKAAAVDPSSEDDMPVGKKKHQQPQQQEPVRRVTRAATRAAAAAAAAATASEAPEQPAKQNENMKDEIRVAPAKVKGKAEVAPKTSTKTKKKTGDETTVIATDDTKNEVGAELVTKARAKKKGKSAKDSIAVSAPTKLQPTVHGSKAKAPTGKKATSQLTNSDSNLPTEASVTATGKTKGKQAAAKPSAEETSIPVRTKAKASSAKSKIKAPTAAPPTAAMKAATTPSTNTRPGTDSTSIFGSRKATTVIPNADKKKADTTTKATKQQKVEVDGNDDGSSSISRAAISQFISFTGADKNTATRFLKAHNGNAESAINSFFSASGVTSSTSTKSSSSSLNKIFEKYCDDPNTPDTVNVSGMMKYLGDIGVDIEDIGMLAVSEIVKSPTMGEMTKDGFVEGWSALGCDTLDKQKSHMKNLVKTLPSSKDVFTRVYKYTFQLAKQGNQKTIPLDMAIPYWSLLFSSTASAIKWSTPSAPWLEWWTEFLNTEWKRAVNKDVWNETLRFAQESLQDQALSFWSEEASWPSVIDEFVGWVKNKRGEGVPVDEMEE